MPASASAELELLRTQVATLTELLAVHEEQALNQFEIIRAQQDTLEATAASLTEIHRLMPEALFTLDGDGVILSVNDAMRALLGHAEGGLVGESVLSVFDGAAGDELLSEAGREAAAGRTLRREALLVSKTGERVPAFLSAVFHGHADHASAAAVCVAVDLRERKRLEMELRHAQKLESVGRLAAGVAHEINTPVQFVSDSLHFLREATLEMMVVVAKLEPVLTSVLAGVPSVEAAAYAKDAIDAADLPYLIEHTPPAFDRCLDGLERVATIVRSLKQFAHPDSRDMTAIDVNQAIRSTLVIARSEYALVADLDTSFADLPAVTGYAGDINQVFLNLIVNAAHAIGDVVNGTDRRGVIAVRTIQEGQQVVISIRDTGTGMSPAIRERIFDPFFTTKEIGKGTGQGLAIARSIVVDKHNGELTVESEVGIGTTFWIRLPFTQEVSTGFPSFSDPSQPHP